MTRFTVFAFIFCSILCSTAFAQELEDLPKSLEVGDKVLDLFESGMLATSGESIALKKIAQNNGLVVIFSCNECPFVVAWEDRYQKIAAFAKDNGFGVALINSNEAKRSGDVQADNFDAMVAHDKEMGYTPMGIFYLLDKESRLANSFQAKVTPHVFLFDVDGILRYKGAIDDNYKSAMDVKDAYLMNAMVSLVNGEEVEVQVTDAIGCSIKRVKK
ncbi:MAG: thioredoxin family protein [Saprospirales bacterium]|nr:thioredoxin family protein [Saprospirales bacterium]